jgi:hypothetical protein
MHSPTTPRASICKRLWTLGIDYEESIPPANVAWGPVRVPGFRTGPPGWESIPRLLTRSTNTGSDLRKDIYPVSS